MHIADSEKGSEGCSAVHLSVYYQQLRGKAYLL